MARHRARVHEDDGLDGRGVVARGLEELAAARLPERRREVDDGLGPAEEGDDVVDRLGEGREARLGDEGLAVEAVDEEGQVHPRGLRRVERRRLAEVRRRRRLRRRAAHLGVDGKVILPPPCIFCMENH